MRGECIHTCAGDASVAVVDLTTVAAATSDEVVVPGETGHARVNKHLQHEGIND